MGNVYFSFIQYRETLLKCGFILYGPVWMHGIFFTSPPLAPNSPKKSKQRAISELFANSLSEKLSLQEVMIANCFGVGSTEKIKVSLPGSIRSRSPPTCTTPSHPYGEASTTRPRRLLSHPSRCLLGHLPTPPPPPLADSAHHLLSASSPPGLQICCPWMVAGLICSPTNVDTQKGHSVASILDHAVRER